MNSVVWVMKPGPTALVAIRNIAPSRAVLAGSEGFGAVSTDGLSGGPSGVAMCRILTVAEKGLSRLWRPADRRAHRDRALPSRCPVTRGADRRIARTTLREALNQLIGCDAPAHSGPKSAEPKR